MKIAFLHTTKISHFGAVVLISVLVSLPFYGFASEPKTPAALIAAIEQRKNELDRLEEKLSVREKRLNLLEEEIKNMLNKYIRLKAEIDEKESQEALAAKKAEEERINRLAKIYQSMEPKDAASRLKQMKKETALGLLRIIKEKQAAKILSNMSAAKATQFSEAFIKAD